MVWSVTFQNHPNHFLYWASIDWMDNPLQKDQKLSSGYELLCEAFNLRAEILHCLYVPIAELNWGSKN